MYSENDMKEFFQNVIDQVATLSTQASKVEGLEQRMQEMYNRLNELEQNNRELQEKLAQANQVVDRVQNELSSVSRDFDNERAVTNNLRETIILTDQRVVSVEQSFRQEQEAHRITTSERDDARRRNDELESSIEGFRSNLHDITEDRNTWRNLATEHEKEVNELKQKLDRVNAVLNPLRVLSGDVQNVG